MKLGIVYTSTTPEPVSYTHLYGWAEGNSFMKWLTNHMLVRGINEFTPHAFSMKYPDPDCPPHFYAGGNNPGFECFTWLMPVSYTHLLFQKAE